MSDSTNMSAVTNMPSPQEKADLKRFFGMTNYLAKLVPELSFKTVPLRDLLDIKNEWV